MRPLDSMPEVYLRSPTPSPDEPLHLADLEYGCHQTRFAITPNYAQRSTREEKRKEGVPVHASVNYHRYSKGSQ